MASLLWWGAAGVRSLSDALGDYVPLREMLAGAAARRRMDMVVSAHWMQQLSAPVGLPLHNLDEVAAYAQQQFIHYFGTDAECWELAPWLHGQQSGAAALNSSASSLWRQLTPAERKRLGRVTPAWAAALASSQRRLPELSKAKSAGYAWVEDCLLTWVVLRAGVVQGVQQLRLKDRSAGALQDRLHMLREPDMTVVLAGYGREPFHTTDIWVVDGDLSDAVPSQSQLQGDVTRWWKSTSPDFHRTRSPWSAWWTWPLLGCAGLVLATSAVQAQQSWVALRDAQEAQALAAQVQAYRKTQRAEVDSSTMKAMPQRSSPATMAALAHPWEQVLTSVENLGSDEQTAGLAWLSLEHEVTRAEIRLEGQVMQKAAAMQLAQDWEASGVWSDVMLHRLQMAPDGGQRFELGARLRRSTAAEAATRAQAIRGAKEPS